MDSLSLNIGVPCWLQINLFLLLPLSLGRGCLTQGCDVRTASRRRHDALAGRADPFIHLGACMGNAFPGRRIGSGWGVDKRETGLILRVYAIMYLLASSPILAWEVFYTFHTHPPETHPLPAEAGFIPGFHPTLHIMTMTIKATMGVL